MHTIYGVTGIPCDSQMRAILDEVDPASLRPAFHTVFRWLQRGKKLESMTLLGGHSLLSGGDGTGFYSSTKVASPYCLKKTRGIGVELYEQQIYAAALVHPDCREVITFFPEMITPPRTVRIKPIASGMRLVVSSRHCGVNPRISSKKLFFVTCGERRLCKFALHTHK